MVNGLWSYRSWDIEERNIKKLLSQQKIWKTYIFKGCHLSNCGSEPNNPHNFLTELNEIFLAVTNKKYSKWVILDILMTRSPRVNMIIRQMTPFFSSSLEAPSVVIFHSCISKPSKFSSMRSPNCIMFWSVKYTLAIQRWRCQAC